jgi:hypothetical protein
MFIKNLFQGWFELSFDKILPFVKAMSWCCGKGFEPCILPSWKFGATVLVMVILNFNHLN